MGDSTSINNADSAASPKQNGLVETKQETDIPISPAAAYFKLWSFASPMDNVLRGIATLAAVGSGTPDPLMAIIFGNLVNTFNGDPPVSPQEFRSAASKNALYFVYLCIAKFACVYVSATLFNITAARMTGRIRLRYLSKVVHQPISYFDKNSPGSIAASLANDTNVVQIGLAEKLGIIFQVLSMIVTAFIIGFIKSWKLTLVSATILPYMFVTTGVFGGMHANAEAKVNQILNHAAGVAEEALSSILNLTALGAVGKIVKKYDLHVGHAMHYLQRAVPLQALIYGNMFLGIYSCYSLSLFYGAKLVNRGDISGGGAVVTVLFCIVIASSSLGLVAPLIPDFTKAIAAAQQIVEMLGDDEPGEDADSVETLNSVRGELELRGVSFSYPERPTIMVINDVSLRIPSNKVTAIVGQSGSGKSTIIGLLEKWYTATQGQLLLDGRDIKHLDSSWLRAQIGLVQQEPVLFNDTIYHNVLNGLRGHDYEQVSDSKKRELVIEACKQANAHGFIEQLPQGYDTPAGERAGLLSGGQRQRIAIARSIIANPKILLLDEATSALDSESERAVSAALEKASRGRTTIMIAHKLSTVVNADNIVVLNQGEIVEQGRHSELAALDGYYCRLLQAQGASDTNAERTTAAEEHLSPAVTRQRTRRSTKDPSSQPLEEITSPLETKEISRRHGLLWCMYKVYSAQPSLILPTIPGLIAAFVAGAAFPIQAFFFSRFTTIFQHQGDDMVSRANFWALMFFILGLSTLFSYLLLFSSMGLVGARVGKIYRHLYLKSILGQDVGFFQATGNTSGGLTTLISADGVDIVMLFATNFGIIVIFVCTLIACAVLSIAVYWKLGLVGSFGCLPVLLMCGFLRMRLDLTAQDRCAAAFLESARYSTEAVAAIRTVSSLTMEKKVENMYHEKLEEASASSVRQSMASMVLFALSESLTLAASGLVFWYGGRLISFGELSSTQFFLIFAAIIFGGQSSGIIFGFTTSINKAHAAMNRIHHLVESKPSINSSTGLDPTSHPTADDTPTVELADVHFRYPSRPTVPVLQGISLTVSRGSHICFVGPSGCGKSTLVALLERFYDVQPQASDEKSHDSGEVRIKGRPISDWDIYLLRKTMGLVAQDTTLYQGTIRDNILLGIQESDLVTEELEERIESACSQANIHSFIMSLPEGYDTDIGARGVALSGGQRQRLALARCLIRNPEILLLDEATSALDAESEKTVREALATARKERDGLTIISVTHQIESMKDADKIFVLDKGVIVEEGNWSALMNKRGRLWGMVVQGEIQG